MSSIEAWHVAISNLTAHAEPRGGDPCDGCDLDGQKRCDEGQQLYADEQAAWLAYRKASGYGMVAP